MITSFLQNSNSPTQLKTRTNKFSSFMGKVIDDNEQEHEIAIEYEYTHYWMGGVSVWSFDYTPNALPNMSDRELCSQVKDLIRDDANCNVTFY